MRKSGSDELDAGVSATIVAPRVSSAPGGTATLSTSGPPARLESRCGCAWGGGSIGAGDASHRLTER